MHLPTLDYNKNVSDIVRADYRTADVFRKYNINYCCGGKILLEEACLQKNISFAEISAKLEEASRIISLPENLHFENWRLDFLIDYIINIHHTYIKESLPALEVNLLSFVGSHAKQFPHFTRIFELFQQILALLNEEIIQEEEIQFPYIKQIDNTFRRKETYGKLFVRTLRKPLDTVDRARQPLNNLLSEMRSITDYYQFPANACTNHQVIFHKLREFDSDLVQHKFLENTILYPRAIDIERQLLLL